MTDIKGWRIPRSNTVIIKSGEAFAEKINAHFITCSAKSADNMDNLERFIVTEAKRFIDELEIKLNYDIENNRQLNNNNNFNLKNKKNKTGKGDCKC